jgi:hypothetical protein
METLASNLWNALRTRLRPAGRVQPHIALQHLMTSPSELDTVRAALEVVGEALSVKFELTANAGDIVLMDADLASRMSPQFVQAFAEERPLVTITGLNDQTHRLLPAAERFERRQRELLVQLREIPLVRRRAAPRVSASAPTVSQGSSSMGFDSGFDSRAHGLELLAAEVSDGHRALLQRVLAGLRSGGVGTLAASYGPGAHLSFDFQARLVTIDPLALQQLRVRRELPVPMPGAKPGGEAQVRDLGETVWDIGLASGPYALLDEPIDWWRTTLAWVPGARVEPYSRVPRYLEMARCLQAQPMSPSGLRRMAHVSVADLRRFLQAGLMVGLLRWQPADTAA